MGDMPAHAAPVVEVSPTVDQRHHGRAAVAFVRGAALLPVLVILVFVGSLVSSAFLTTSNLTGAGQQISALGVTVVGESLILLVGGMDLSLESTLALAP